MPVRRLHSLAEAEESCWRDPRDPVLWRQIKAVWEMSRRLAPHSFPPGVHKHRSLEEANLQSDLWLFAGGPRDG